MIPSTIRYYTVCETGLPQMLVCIATPRCTMKETYLAEYRAACSRNLSVQSMCTLVLTRNTSHGSQ